MLEVLPWQWPAAHCHPGPRPQTGPSSFSPSPPSPSIPPSLLPLVFCIRQHLLAKYKNSNNKQPTVTHCPGPFSSSSLSHLCRLFARKTKTQQLSDRSLLLLLLIFFLFATSEAQMLVHWSIVKSLQNHFDKVHLLIERPLSRNLTAKRDWLPSGTKNLRLSYSYLTNLILK